MKPELVIFDYGHTLCYEDYFRVSDGGHAIYELISSNKNNVSEEEFCAFTEKMYKELSAPRREMGLELPALCFTNILRGYFGIEFSCDEVALQEAYWNSISPPHAMDGAGDVLSFIKNRGIKIAVLSNLWYDTEVLKRRIDRLIPENGIDLFISTAQYGVRKPNRLIFDITLQRLGVKADRAIFVGDEPQADIQGAYNAGIYPIWFKDERVCPYKMTVQPPPDFECREISKLEMLEQIIDNMEG